MEQSLKALVLDIDGTLLNDTGKFSSQDFEAIHACHKAGIEVLIATARPPRLVFRTSESAHDTAFFDRHGAFYNGALVSHPRLGIRHSWDLDGDLTNRVCTHIEQRGYGVQVALQFEDAWHSFRFEMSDHDLAGWGYSRQELLPYANARLQPCSKMCIFGACHEVTALYALLCQEYAEALNVYLSDKMTWLQIIAKDTDKAVGIQYVLTAMSLSPRNGVYR